MSKSRKPYGCGAKTHHGKHGGKYYLKRKRGGGTRKVYY